MTFDDLLFSEQDQVIREFEEMIAEADTPSKEDVKDPLYKPGRERLVSALRNKLKKKGVNISRNRLRVFCHEKYKLWKSRDPKVNWILRLEKKAKKLGFDPRWHDAMGAGSSRGTKKSEYAGRAYFFVGLMNGYIRELTAKKKKLS